MTSASFVRVVLFTLRWVLSLMARSHVGLAWSLGVIFTLGWVSVSFNRFALRSEGGDSCCRGVNFLVIMLLAISSNIEHRSSTFDCRFLSGRCRNDLVLRACAKSFAVVAIYSSAVILGQLNLSHLDQWKVFTMLDLRVFGLCTMKHCSIPLQDQSAN